MDEQKNVKIQNESLRIWRSKKGYVQDQGYGCDVKGENNCSFDDNDDNDDNDCYDIEKGHLVSLSPSVKIWTNL